MPLDNRGRTVLNVEQSEMLVLFLSRTRKTALDDQEGILRNWTDIRQVLHSLRDAGFAIIPQGTIDTIRKELDGISGPLTSGMAGDDSEPPRMAI